MAFDLRAGCHADVSELEYIAALHQTGNDVRPDASIIDEDIQLFLKSRYGIVVTLEQVKDTILYGLGGGGGGSQDASMLDIMEVTAILLIPILLKSADLQLQDDDLPRGVRPPPTNLIPTALEIMLQDVTGSKSPPKLTTELLKQIFLAYGNIEMAHNQQLLKDMVECCQDMDGKSSYRQNCQGNDDEENNLRSVSCGAVLDSRTFATALTYDVEMYDIRDEMRMTTHKDDVFLPQYTNTTVQQDRDTKSDQDLRMSDFEYRQCMASSQPVQSVFTFPNIDLTADTYRSKSLIVFLWACVLLTYYAYWFELSDSSEGCKEIGIRYEYSSPWNENVDALACEIAVKILEWLLFFLFLGLFGLVFVGFASMGNDVNCHRWYWPVLGSVVVLLFTVIPFATRLSKTSGQSETRYLMFVSFILGLVVCVYHWSHALSLWTPEAWLRKFPALRKRLNPSTIKAESNIKHALAFKLNTLTQNAMDIMTMRAAEKEMIVTTNFGRGLYFYSKFGLQSKTVGGFLWTYRHIRDKSLYREEGIWYSARFLASNICQYVVAIYVLWGGISLTKRAVNDYDQETVQSQANVALQYVFGSVVHEALVEELATNFTFLIADYMGGPGSGALNCSTGQGEDILDEYCQSSTGGFFQCDSNQGVNYLCGLVGNNASTLSDLEKNALLNASGFDSDLLMTVSRAALQKAADDSVNSLYPSSQYMITVPLIIGVIIAFLVAINLSVNFIPSVTGTILKLRSGAIPLIGNPMLNKYRQSPETVALLTGSLFWGALVASVVTGGVFALVIFFFLWQGTAYFAQRFAAVFIGVLVVTLLRLLIITCCRVNFFKGLYRKRPGAANLGILALEWASFALSSGFIFVRMVKLLLVAGFSIGRIDRPFLAPGVGQVGTLELDNFPTIFVRDILAHEAHRHPYLELLGKFYLMKLRYGEHFGKAAGSAWRLLFVYALMPWLHRYRLATRSELASTAFTSGDFDPEAVSSPFSTASLRMSMITCGYSSRMNFSRKSLVDEAKDVSDNDEDRRRRSSFIEEPAIGDIIHGEANDSIKNSVPRRRRSSRLPISEHETIEMLREENAVLLAELAKCREST